MVSLFKPDETTWYDIFIGFGAIAVKGAMSLLGLGLAVLVVVKVLQWTGVIS